MKLTARSVTLIVVAAVCLAVAFAAGVPALLYVVGLCAGLVGVAVIVALASRPELTAGRSVSPAVAEPEQPVTVTIDLAVRSAVPIAAGAWRDRLSPGLVGTARGDLPAVRGASRVSLTYEVTGRRRGRHLLGPLSVVAGDAFGLTARAVRVEGKLPFIVLPRRADLSDAAGHTDADDGVSRARRSSGLGQDDVIARPYLPGDAMKRWHWKATAHRGEAMVRQEETERRPSVTVLVDADPRTHDPSGFEWCVTAAASILAHHVERGFDVALASSGLAVTVPAGQASLDAMVALALLEPSSVRPAAMTRDVVTYVLAGRLGPDAAARLVAEVASRHTVIFVSAGTGPEALQCLAVAGWQIVVRHDHEDVAAVWARAGSVVSR